jgi:Xaa-Pro aminopeptidase
MIKTAREISCIKKAAEIANSCIPIIEKAVKEGATEKEISRRIRKNIYSRGGRLSFRTLVASGERSAMIHCKPAATDRPVSGIGYVDFGASWKGYKSDVTVPFIRGKIGKKERDIVKSVQEAYRKAIRFWRPGMECWKLHEVADSHIRSRGFNMGHSIGHGIGKRVHENPVIYAPDKKTIAKVEKLASQGNRKAKKRLARWRKIKKARFLPGIVFTIEPGAYVPKIGGSRLENTFLVCKKNLKCLTKAKLIEV